MSNKALNDSIDANLQASRERRFGKEPKKSGIIKLLKTCKSYFFPKDDFEPTADSADGFTVVRKVDHGFKKDVKTILKSKEKPKESEDIDMKLVEETIRKNRI